MWTVELNKQVKNGLRKLPLSVRNALTVWINIAHIEGPVGLWKGYRSSRLSKQYRVIYQVHKDIVRIVVLDVTAHDYRRK